MPKNKLSGLKQQNPIHIVIFILVTIAILVVGFVAYKQINPYFGWKTYTLTQEKLSMKYPPNWKVSDDSQITEGDLRKNNGCDLDFVSFTSPDGSLSVNIQTERVALEESTADILSSESITLLGQPHTLHFKRGLSSKDDKVDYLALTTANKNNYGYIKITPKNWTCADKNDVATIGIGGMYLENETQTAIEIDALKNHPDFQELKLILSSMSYNE